MNVLRRTRLNSYARQRRFLPPQVVEIPPATPAANSPRRNPSTTLKMKRFYLDRYPVTNAEFKKFMDATKYRPKDDYNVLKDWKGGANPAGWENKLVTWVSLEDARAYTAWAGKRLPHEWEWPYVAQGTDGRTYPCGNSWDPQAVPVPETGHDLRGPDNVDAHPEGASPFGVMDLTSNVWLWTDEYLDEHTRAPSISAVSSLRNSIR